MKPNRQIITDLARDDATIYAGLMMHKDGLSWVDTLEGLVIALQGEKQAYFSAAVKKLERGSFPPIRFDKS